MRSVQRQVKVLIVILALSVTGYFVWRSYVVRREQKVFNAYLRASQGDRSSLNILASYDDRYAQLLLKQLLYNSTPSTDRMEVARLLRRKGLLSDGELGSFLDIHRLRPDRHIAFVIFHEGGCSEICVEAALRALLQLWAGQKVQEEEVLSQLTRIPGSKELAERAHQEAESDMVQLLDTNPCGVEKALKEAEFSKGEFAKRVRLRTTSKQKCGT